jgi:type VI secretion system protein ImpC
LTLGESFNHDGWKLQPGEYNVVEGLPMHVYKEEGESVAKPCAEAALSERALERLAAGGFIPLLSPRGQNVVKVVGFRSLCQSDATLRGRWRR